MSELEELQQRFALTDDDTNQFFDIVNWVTSMWLRDKFGYPKDNPISYSLAERFRDPLFVRFLKAELIDHELEEKILKKL